MEHSKLPDDNPIPTCDPELCDPLTDTYFHSIYWRLSGIIVFLWNIERLLLILAMSMRVTEPLEN
jgi:hypothetical protein